MSRPVDLLAEYDAAICRAQTPEARAWRERQGWPRVAVLQGLGGGVARIACAGDGTYEPTDREGVGTPAILIPAWDGPAPGRRADLLDVIAWTPGNGQLIPRLGVADVIGAWAIHIAGRCMGESRPLRVFSDPRRWAAAAQWDGEDSRGGHGVLIVNWAEARGSLWHLVGNAEFVADDLLTGRRLKNALQPPKLPAARILVRADTTEVAA